MTFLGAQASGLRFHIMYKDYQRTSSTLPHVLYMRFDLSSPLRIAINLKQDQHLDSTGSAPPPAEVVNSRARIVKIMTRKILFEIFCD